MGKSKYWQAKSTCIASSCHRVCWHVLANQFLSGICVKLNISSYTLPALAHLTWSKAKQKTTMMPDDFIFINHGHCTPQAQRKRTVQVPVYISKAIIASGTGMCSSMLWISAWCPETSPTEKFRNHKTKKVGVPKQTVKSCIKQESKNNQGTRALGSQMHSC